MLDDYAILVSPDTLGMDQKFDYNGDVYRPFFYIGQHLALPDPKREPPFVLIYKRLPHFMRKIKHEYRLYKTVWEKIANQPLRPRSIKRTSLKTKTFLRAVRQYCRTHGYCFFQCAEIVQLMFGIRLTFPSRNAWHVLGPLCVPPQLIAGVRERYLGRQKDVDTIVDINGVGTCGEALMKYGGRLVYRTCKRARRVQVINFPNAVRAVDVRREMTGVVHLCYQFNDDFDAFVEILHGAPVTYVTMFGPEDWNIYSENAIFHGVLDAHDFGCPCRKLYTVLVYDGNRLKDYVLQDRSD